MTNPVFTCDALRATLELDDTEHFEHLWNNLTSAQWEHLALAVNLSGSYPRGAMSLGL